MTRINGGFFWGAGGITVDSSEECVISNNVFMARPKWYQVRQWFQAVQAWIRLCRASSTRSSEQSAIISFRDAVERDDIGVDSDP